MKIPVRYRLVLALLLIAVGVVLGWAPYRNSRLNTPSVPVTTAVVSPEPMQSSAVASATDHKDFSGKPVRITIPSLGIDVPVIDGY